MGTLVTTLPDGEPNRRCVFLVPPPPPPEGQEGPRAPGAWLCVRVLATVCPFSHQHCQGNTPRQSKICPS